MSFDADAPPASAPPRPARLLSALIALGLFLLCVAVRASLECGFILGDDPAVVAITDVKLGDISWRKEQVNLRFGVWIQYLLATRIFGTGELGFLAPSWIVSSSFASIAFLLLRWNGYALAGALFGGLFVGLAPFEVLIGATIANDIWFAATLVYGYVAWQGRARFPVLAGVLIALCLWFGFFNKAWAVYVVPFLGIAFLQDLYHHRPFRFWAALVSVTYLLHGLVALSLKRALGEYFPLLTLLPAHYPVPWSELSRVLLQYPYQILYGDPATGTTLFGPVPYVWVGALLGAFLLRGPRAFARDRFGTELLALGLGMFLLINFVPNYYSLTEYHSAPRIFRYLTPISFFLSLHAAKLLLDCARVLGPRLPAAVLPACAVGLLAANLAGAWRATAPGREQRRAIEAVVASAVESCPPVLLMESWQSYFFGRLYLRDRCPNMSTPLIATSGARDPKAAAAIREREATLPPGSMAVTGLGGAAYYACWSCGLDPSALGPGWERTAQAGRLTYRPQPVDVEVWRWRGPAKPAAAGAAPG